MKFTVSIMATTTTDSHRIVLFSSTSVGKELSQSNISESVGIGPGLKPIVMNTIIIIIVINNLL